MDEKTVLGLQRQIQTLTAKVESQEEVIIRLGNQNKRLEAENSGFMSRMMTEKPVEKQDLNDADYNIFGLTKKEHRILMALIREGNGVSRTGVLFHLYPGENKAYEIDAKIVDVFICKIRKKMLDTYEFPRDTIETIWGRGYRISPKWREAVEARIGWEKGG